MHIHLVGIGGAGLSAIARVLLGMGYAVSGSDQAASELTAALAAEGATVTMGHAAENMAGADLLLISSAIPPENPEELVNAIMMLKDNPGKCQKMGKNGRVFAEKYYDRKKLARKYLTLLEKVALKDED